MRKKCAICFPLVGGGCFSGTTTVHNFHANETEIALGERRVSLELVLSEPGSRGWRDSSIGSVAYGDNFAAESSLITSQDISGDEFDPFSEKPSYANVGFLWFRRDSDDVLLSHSTGLTRSPNWRATVSIGIDQHAMCYQGEIQPFRVGASLLSFFPLPVLEGGGQCGLGFLNMSADGKVEEHAADVIYFACDGSVRDIDMSKSVYANRWSYLPLKAPDDVGITICLRTNSIAGIPFLISRSSEGYLSMEHSHPPSSYMLGGNRIQFQARVKQVWQSYLSEKLKFCLKH